ncbi:MAG: cupin domain-containing protein [Arenibacterium sp.]
MPRVDSVPVYKGDGELGRFEVLRLSDAGELTQFGAVVETLWPGGKSSKAHWHLNEDEMVYMLEGEAILVEGENESRLMAGEAACFKAGVEIGHHLENRTNDPIRYLVIGTRSNDELVTYTRDGSTVATKDGVKTYRDSNGVITSTKLVER